MCIFVSLKGSDIKAVGIDDGAARIGHGNDDGTRFFKKVSDMVADRTEPLNGERMSIGVVAIRGSAYAGKAGIKGVDVSVDNGRHWIAVTLIGPEEPYAWRHWEYLWSAKKKGDYTIMARATDSKGRRQPERAHWNALGYGNNGIREHAIVIHIA